jgi:hypothetical protein
MKVGRRLQNSAEALTMSARHEPCERVVVGLDGGYVRSRHRRPEYNFEVVAGKVLDQEGSGACFAFVRDGGSAGENAAALTLRRSGLNESTSVTVLPDGALGEYALAEIERAKWRFWNGYAERGIIGLVYLAHWTAAQRFDHLPSLKKLSKSLLDVIRYLESNSDSMPD